MNSPASDGFASSRPASEVPAPDSGEGISTTVGEDQSPLDPDLSNQIADPLPTSAGVSGSLPAPGTVVGGRYRLVELMAQRGLVARFRGLDLCSGQNEWLPIVVLLEPSGPDSTVQEAARAERDGDAVALDELGADDPESLLADTKIDMASPWPSIGWEKRVLARTPHLSMPRVLDNFCEGGFEYLIEEVPVGRSLWDAWEETPVSWARRCTWLIQIAEALDQLHGAGAIVDGLRPDIIVVTPTSQAVFADLTDVLPLPVAGDMPVGKTRYSAPELSARDGRAGPRSDLYGFGAMLQALMFGRELTDLDFTPQGRPRPYLERDPDAHPILGRILARTFVREVGLRFPSADMFDEDPTGFAELIANLKICAKTMESVRLDIAAWSSTGVVRSGNEDAVAVLHSVEARLEATDDFAVITLADGMGGMASGELAAALSIQCIRDYFLKHPPFTDLLMAQSDGKQTLPKPTPFPILIDEALHIANQTVCEVARSSEMHRGMGCTAEVVLIDGRQVYVGHVGDSRVYHLRRGKLSQVTMDHTLVSQLVALGQLTQEEADRHPQRAELQQAIGGRRDLYPDHHELTLEAGDWLLVCSDGLTNQLRPQEIAGIIQSAGSAEKAARRLINQAIVQEALDNVTVAVVRVC